MNLRTLAAVGTAAASLAAPGLALAGNGNGNGNQPKGHGPKASNPVPTKAKGNAYGKYCEGQSKEHVAGQQGTPFSQCVTAMAQLAGGHATSPKEACKTLSKKHVAGQKGTPYSRCITAAAHLLKDQHKQPG
jgi:hypothetical protein